MKRKLYILKLQKDEKKKQEKILRSLKKEARQQIQLIRKMFQD